MRRLRSTKCKNVVRVTEFLAVALLLLVLLFVLHRVTGTICLFHGVIGIPSPGCGLTRAHFAFFSGRFADAFRYHPLFWAVSILATDIIYTHIRPKSGSKWRKILIAIIIIAFVLLFIVRMITLFPHSEPMTINTYSLMGRLVRLFA